MARRLPAEQLKVGSIPTGVSDRPTVCSDYIFLLRSPGLSYSFVGRSPFKPNCLLRVHGRPEEAMPGDRLADGA